MSEYLDFDLNLLRALDALLAERNVTRAARRAGVTQSAMSRSLARLRVVFADPLLVRTRHGMDPTPRARALVEPLRRVFESVVSAVTATAAFDPAVTTRSFTVGTTDLAEQVLLPGVVERLAADAPGASLVTRRIPTDSLGSLESGEIDLAVGPPYDLPSSLAVQKLYDESFVCILRRGHPAARGRLTAKRYAALSHLLVAPRERPGGPVDDALAALGLQRRVAVRVPSFLVAPELVARSELIATLPRRLAEGAARYLPLMLVEPPVAVAGFAMCQVWHPRSDHDEGHRWLRRLLLTTARALRSPG